MSCTHSNTKASICQTARIKSSGAYHDFNSLTSIWRFNSLVGISQNRTPKISEKDDLQKIAWNALCVPMAPYKEKTIAHVLPSWLHLLLPRKWRPQQLRASLYLLSARPFECHWSPPAPQGPQEPQAQAQQAPPQAPVWCSWSLLQPQGVRFHWRHGFQPFQVLLAPAQTSATLASGSMESRGHGRPPSKSKKRGSLEEVEVSKQKFNHVQTHLGSCHKDGRRKKNK